MINKRSTNSIIFALSFAVVVVVVLGRPIPLFGSEKHFLTHNETKPLTSGTEKHKNADVLMLHLENTDELEYNPCSNSFCKQGRTCEIKDESYVCVCPNGWKGENCEKAEDCPYNPCLNGATCWETDNSHECICSEEYMGIDCSIKKRCNIWVKANGNEVPPGALDGGHDENNPSMYVARANLARYHIRIFPGKLLPTSGMYVSYDNKPLKKRTYWVLLDCDYRWDLFNKGSSIPSKAVIGGYSNNETLYIGRVYVGESLIIGRVQDKTCWYVDGETEKGATDKYEILVQN